jgi:hypothetical protein
MDHSDNDFLLSAYLDGELSAAEQANVEQLLATSAEARQIVDELRALRTSLQELPRHKLGPEFVEQVLRRAEVESREVEVGSRESGVGGQESGIGSRESEPPAVHRPRIFNRRGIAWSVVAIAAAVVLMVTNRHADHQPAAHRGIEEETIARAPLHDKNAEIAGAAVEPQPARQSLSSAEPRFAAASPNQNHGAALDQGGAPADASGMQAASGATLKSEISQELQPAVPLAVERMDARKTADSYSFGITQNSTSPLWRDQAGESLEQRAAGAKADFDRSSIAADQPSASPAGTAAAGVAIDSSAAAKSDGLGWNFSKTGDDLVVIVDVSPEAARSGAFDQLLAKNRIAMDDTSLERGLRRQRSEQLSDDAQMRFKAAEEHKLEREADKADATKSDATVRDLEAITRDESLGIRLSDGRDVDAVYVEAAPEQIQATLAALASDRAEFPSVAVNGSQELRDRLLRDAAEMKDKVLSESEKYNEQPESLNKQVTAGKRAANPAEADAVSGSPQAAPSAGGGARGRGGFGGRAGGGGFGGGGGAGRGSARGGQFGGAAPADGLGSGGAGGGAGTGGAANGMGGGGGGGSGPVSSAAAPAATSVPTQAEQDQRASKLGRARRLNLYDSKTAADEKSKLSNLAKDAAQSVDGRNLDGSFGNLDAAAASTRGTNAANAPPVVLGELQGDKGAVNGIAAQGAGGLAGAAEVQKEAVGRVFQRSSEGKVAELGDATKALAATTRRALFVLRVVNPPANSDSVSGGADPAKPAAGAPTIAPAASEPAKR